MTPKSRLRATAEFLILSALALVSAAAIIGVAGLLLTGQTSPRRDSIAYWAAGRQMIHHSNPYDPGAILQIQRAVGYPEDWAPLMMRNPPSALLLALPLGLMNLRTASLLWSGLLLAALIASVQLLWIMHGRPKNYLHLLSYSFGPALTCLISGQTSLFALLGLVLFLRTHRTSPFLAGMSLWLCALKPHLFLPFGAALVIWICWKRAYRILSGASLALAASSLISLLFDPHSFLHYTQMLRTSGIPNEFLLCLSFALRTMINRSAIWLQYAPSVLGCAWAVFYFWKNRDKWSWMEHGSLLMLVSIITTPYAWFSDQALAIPALLHAAYLTRSRNLLLALALSIVIIDLQLSRGVSLHSFQFLWAAPAWLAWYLYAVKTSLTKQTEPLQEALATRM